LSESSPARRPPDAVPTRMPITFSRVEARQIDAARESRSPCPSGQQRFEGNEVMKITIDARSPAQAGADLLALPVARIERKSARLPAALASADRATRGQIQAAVASGDFQGKPDQSLLVYPDRRLRPKRVLLLGTGD